VIRFTEIFLVVAEIGLLVPTYPEFGIPHYKIIQPHRLPAFTDQSSQNFPHL